MYSVPKIIFQRMIGRYSLMWLRKKTGELVLTTGQYTLVTPQRKYANIDWWDEGRSGNSRLEVFLRKHEFVGEAWKQ